MSLPYVLWRIASDGGTVSASSASEGYPASNLLLPNVNVGQCWKSAGSSADESVVFDLGQARLITSLVALGHDLAATTTNLRLEANSSDSWGSPAFSRALTWRDGALREFFTGEFYRYWRLAFTKPSAGTIATISRVLLGEHFPFTQGASARSVGWGSQEATQLTRTKGGAAFGDVAAHLDTRRFKVEGINQALRDEIDALNKALGLHSPFYLVLDHDNYPVTSAIYGTLARKIEFRDRRWTSSILYDTDLDIVEAK